jgi:DNA-binding FrmR family transcriptional regulator
MDKGRAVSRLRRLEGQVRGVEKMVNEERSLTDLITQLSAIKASASGLISSLIQERFEAKEEGLVLNPEDTALLLRLLKD